MVVPPFLSGVGQDEVVRLQRARFVDPSDDEFRGPIRQIGPEGGDPVGAEFLVERDLIAVDQKLEWNELDFRVTTTKAS